MGEWKDYMIYSYGVNVGQGTARSKKEALDLYVEECIERYKEEMKKKHKQDLGGTHYGN